MTPQQGREVCSNRQSAAILGRGNFAKLSYTFIVPEKSLIYSFFCCIFGIRGGRGLVENVTWAGGGW